MTDAYVGARYYDAVVGSEFEIVGIYETTVRNEDGEFVTEVIVDAKYEGTEAPDDLTRIELERFKTDPSIEMTEKPSHL